MNRREAILTAIVGPLGGTGALLAALSSKFPLDSPRTT